jgi:hypothetical protein
MHTAEAFAHKRLEDLLVVLVLLVSSRAALVNFADAFQLGVFALALAFWLLRGGGISPVVIAFLLLSLLWLGLHALIDGVIVVRTWAGHFLRLLTAAFVIGAVSRPLERLSRWVVMLAALSLGLYAAGLVLPGLPEALYRLAPEPLRFVGGTQVGETLTGSWRRASWLVYTVAPDRAGQNHGFMWEPAAFGMVLALALWARLLAGRIGLDPGNIVLLAAMASTFSTTTWIGAMVSVAFILWRHGGGWRLLLLPTIPAAVLACLTADFLLPKIIKEIQSGYAPYMRWSLSRMASFHLDIADLAQMPLPGRGLVISGDETARLPSNNGLSDYLARYGLVMSLASASLLVTSLRRAFGADVTALAGFLAVLLIFAWAEKYWELPLFQLWLFAGFSGARPHHAALRAPGQAHGARGY